MRRTPLGTRPPFDESVEDSADPLADASGEIVVVVEPRQAAHEAACKAALLRPDQEHSVIVELDASWLARLELPPD
jgi:hypothetical protein